MNTVLGQQMIVKRPGRRMHFLVKQLRKPFRYGSYLLLVFGITITIWVGLTHSAYFVLKKVEVVGNLRVLSTEDILAAAQIPAQINLFRIPLQQVKQNILSQPWVESVSIRRQIPNLLWIHIKEYQPKALLLDKQLSFVSEEGKLFKQVETESQRNFVVLTGFQNRGVIPQALELIEFFEKKVEFGLFGLAEIHYNDANGFSLVTLKGPMEIKLGKENFEEKLKRFVILWKQLHSKLGAMRGIDLNYEDKAFVKL